MNVPEQLVEENNANACGDKMQIVSRNSKGRGWSGPRTCSTVNASTGQVQNTGRWTDDEHTLLLEGIQRHGSSSESWTKISTTLVKTRTVEQIEAYARRHQLKAGVDNARVRKVAKGVTQMNEFLVHRRKLLAWVQESRMAAEARVMKIREDENATSCLDEVAYEELEQEPSIQSKDTDVLDVVQQSMASDLECESSSPDGDNQFDLSNPPLLPPLSPPPLDSSAFVGGLPLLGHDQVAPFPYESSSAYPADLDSLQRQLLQQPLNTISKLTKPVGSASSKLTTKKANSKSTTKKVKGTGKKRGTYNNYKDEAGQQKVKHAIETFLERRRMNSMASLRAFAAEVDIKYETLKPYCREDESKRKTFVIKGQTKLVPEVRFFDIIYMKR